MCKAFGHVEVSCPLKAAGGGSSGNVVSCFKHHVLRSSFVLWMVCWGRLSTKDRLVSWVITYDTRGHKFGFQSFPKGQQKLRHGFLKIAKGCSDLA